MREKRVRILAAVTMLCLFVFGAAMVPMVRAQTIPTFEGVISDGEWIYFEIDLQSGLEASVELIPETEDCDLDLYVFGPNDELIMMRGTASGYEIGYFIIPYDTTYSIGVHAYYVPYGEEVVFTLHVVTGENIIPEPPLVEPNEGGYGGIRSYAKSHREGILHCDVNSAISIARSELLTNDIVFFWLSPSPWQRPLARFCAEDALIVGQFTIQLNPRYYPTMVLAQEAFEVTTVEHFINGVSLETYITVESGPVRSQHGDKGELISFFKRMDAGFFKPGELAELIGLGVHELTTVQTYPNGYVETDTGYFELVSCASS